MLLLFDIGNTHTHVGLATATRISKHADLPTAAWSKAMTVAASKTRRLVGTASITGVVICSVVPRVTPKVCRFCRRIWRVEPLVLSPRTLAGVAIRYPKPHTIGPDRLANAIAVHHHYGAPAVVVDFGTAVTFDVVDRQGAYVGGIIAPGLAAMTDYLHEKTALLPRIRIRETKAVIGKNTVEAMLIGAVHGYRGLIRGLIHELKLTLRTRRLPVIATGGYAGLMAARLPEINAVEPLLTLEGLRLLWLHHQPAGKIA